jgi:hypothetical protein
VFVVVLGSAIHTVLVAVLVDVDDADAVVSDDDNVPGCLLFLSSAVVEEIR